MSDMSVMICMAWTIAQLVVEKGDVSHILNLGKLCYLSKSTFFYNFMFYNFIFKILYFYKILFL